jgi:hypothetical protein
MNNINAIGCKGRERDFSGRMECQRRCTKAEGHEGRHSWSSWALTGEKLSRVNSRRRVEVINDAADDRFRLMDRSVWVNGTRPLPPNGVDAPTSLDSNYPNHEFDAFQERCEIRARTE